jgi:pimeloyl-ACP methyl ester carboxylesterase
VLKIAFSSDERASEESVLRMTSNQSKRTDRLLDDWTAWHRAYPVSRANALRQLLAATRFVAPLQKPAPRVLLLSSRADGLVNPRCSQSLAEQWHCDIAEHPKAGHDLPLDDGPWVADQVKLWL